MLCVACGAGDSDTSDTGDSTTRTTGTTGTTIPTSGEPTDTAGTTWVVDPFLKFPEREFRGQVFDGAWVASDPCVIKDGSIFRMFYTCVAGAAVGGICGVTSPDGITWTPVASIEPGIDGLIARGRPGAGWDENMETCAIVRDGDAYALYYSGYPNLDMQGDRGPAALGVLRSADAIAFTRETDAPVFEPVPAGPDGDDIFSAVLVPDGDALAAVYVGWCVDGYHDGLTCAEGPAIQLLGATRSADATWTRRADPVLAPRAEPAWLADGVAEPDIVRGPDGEYYLFVTGALGDDEARVTGVAVGPTPFGPWDLNPEPVLRGDPGSFDACGALAPSVVIDGDAVRMWYLGIDDCGGACPGCDHAQCGCSARFTIGYAEATWPLRG